MMAHVLNWSLALVPVLLMTGAFVWLDIFKLVTVRETLGLLLLGGLAAIAAYPLSGIFLDTMPIGFNYYSRFVAPWIEEILKAFVILSLFFFNRIGLKLDAVIMGFAVGAGFSVVENLFYLTRFLDLSPSVWMVRGIGTAIMHGTTGAVMGAIAHRLTVRDMHHSARDYHFKPWRFIPGYLVAVAIHTLFNQFPSQPMLAMLGTALIAPMALMAILRFGTNEATEWLEEEREAHRALLATLYAGSFPDTPGWRKIAALAEREDGQTADRIREYVLVLTRLIVSEEDVLLRQSHDTHRVETDGRKLFARLDEIKRELGPTTVHALTSLLPFSRSDYWEAWELHHHLDHQANAAARP